MYVQKRGFGCKYFRQLNTFETSATVAVAAVCDRRIPAFIGNSPEVTDRR
jgi:hypothetical protein